MAGRDYLSEGNLSSAGMRPKARLKRTTAAGRQAQSGYTRQIFTGPGLAYYRRRPPSSNIGQSVRVPSLLQYPLL